MNNRDVTFEANNKTATGGLGGGPPSSNSERGFISRERKTRPPGGLRRQFRNAARVDVGLLDLDRRSHLLELLLDGRGLVLAEALLDHLRRTVHQVLGLLQAEARDLADDLDHVDLLVAGARQLHGELGLLLRRGRRSARRGAARRRHHHGGRDCGRHAPLLLQRLHELGNLHDRELAELVRDRLNVSHLSVVPFSSKTAAVFPQDCGAAPSSFSWCALSTRTSWLAGVFSRRTSRAAGACIRPSSRARISGRLGIVERAFTPSASSIWLPDTTPAFTTSCGCSLAKSTRTLASITGSLPV